MAAYDAGRRDCAPWPEAATVADGLLVPKPFGDRLLMDAVYDTDGCAVAVDDDELLADLALCGRLEGAFICPEGATTITAVRKLRERGWLLGSERIVILNTGTGLKYPGTVDTDLPVLKSAGVIETPDGRDRP